MKQISYTPAHFDEASGVSYVMLVDDRDFAEKKQLFEAGEPKDVPMQPYQMYKTTKQNTSLVPAPENEVLHTFGSINGNKILEFMFQQGNLNGKIQL